MNSELQQCGEVESEPEVDVLGHCVFE